MSGFVLDPQGGDAYGFHGSRVLIKASGNDTLGQLAVIESVYPPGLSVHVHVHDGEDEMFYVIAGELAGTTSAKPAIALVITGPPRLDQQIVARAEPVPDVG
jgi:quercetin dioxygenase-like cupin family protein